MSDPSDRSDRPKDGTELNRRDFLVVSGAVGVAAAAGVSLSGGAAKAVEHVQAGYPVLDVAAAGELDVGSETLFEYPDPDSPAILLRLREAVEGGVGPEGDIVAYSLLCTHKGCPVTFNAEREMLVCPCHWSSFDPAKSGRIIIGQASQPLPRIELKVTDAGMVQAFGVDGLIYGRHTNIL